MTPPPFFAEGITSNAKSSALRPPLIGWPAVSLSQSGVEKIWSLFVFNSKATLTITPRTPSQAHCDRLWLVGGPYLSANQEPRKLGRSLYCNGKVTITPRSVGPPVHLFCFLFFFNRDEPFFFHLLQHRGGLMMMIIIDIIISIFSHRNEVGGGVDRHETEPFPTDLIARRNPMKRKWPTVGFV